METEAIYQHGRPILGQSVRKTSDNRHRQTVYSGKDIHLKQVITDFETQSIQIKVYI